jgi:hypothetical protein
MVTAHGLDEASMDLTMTTRAIEIALPLLGRATAPDHP